MDVQDIQPGQDFAQAIQETIAKCHVLIAVIGPRWLENLKQRGEGQDFVEDEIDEALRKNLTVIPVLVNGASMPDSKEIPENLQHLCHRQAVEIRDSRFDDDFAQLAKVLRTAPGIVMSGRTHAGRWKWLAGAAALIALAVVLFFLMRSRPPELSGAWIAEMHKKGQPVYRIRLDLVAGEGTVSGTVEYPTGKAVIGNGAIAGPKITFQTVHTPQFESSPATIHFEAEVVGTSIHLTSVDDNGIATGIAHRITPGTGR